MSDEDNKKKRRKLQAEKQQAQTAAAWIVTFADLMSLLMAFFVMLFALSEVDKEKFKILGYSMKQAFGVPTPATLSNNEHTKNTDPNTSHGKRSADQDARKPLDKRTKDNIPLAVHKKLKDGNSKVKPLNLKFNHKGAHKAIQAMQQDNKITKRDFEKLKKIFGAEIKRKHIELKLEHRKIIVRILGGDAFDTGSTKLTAELYNALLKLGDALNNIKGKLTVSGHTDDRPIQNMIYRSNWELSAARAYSVIKILTEIGKVDRKRITLRGFADTRNVVPNDTETHRARNRRVEVMIDQRYLDLNKLLKEDQKLIDKNSPKP